MKNPASGLLASDQAPNPLPPFCPVDQPSEYVALLAASSAMGSIAACVLVAVTVMTLIPGCSGTLTACQAFANGITADWPLRLLLQNIPCQLLTTSVPCTV